ncbi:MAG: glycosyltransferase [Spirulina sp. SIO3F2]|nr:glycosyltransferase [Spirulina sp. SIO3F2]
MPKVSICIPTYNRSHLLPIAIASVLTQTDADWELLVCDDGSTDATPEVMASYQDDPRIRYLRHEHNIGKSNNMRSGYLAAEGQYFLKFDDDDGLTPEFLAQTVSVLATNPHVDFVGTDHWIIDEHNQRDLDATIANSKFWKRHKLPAGVVKNLLKQVFVHQSFQVGATLFRTAALQDVDFMRPDLQNCEDNDLLVRLALAGKVGYYLPERLMEYRRHPEQTSRSRALRYLEDKAQYLRYFQFEDMHLEQVRRNRLQDTELQLGLRLIEVGQTQRGRALLQEKPGRKAQVGRSLAYLPLPLRQWCFARIRQMQS